MDLLAERNDIRGHLVNSQQGQQREIDVEMTGTESINHTPLATPVLSLSSLPMPPAPLITPVVEDIPPPHRVPHNPLFTREIGLVPGAPFPTIASRDQERVKAWMELDSGYANALAASETARRQEWSARASNNLEKQDWLGPMDSHGSAKMILESSRLTDRAAGKRGGRIPIPLIKSELKRIASQPEMLIPIRVDFEYEAYKLRDTFTWNLKESVITPEIFASHLCDDLRLPRNPFYKEIVGQVTAQIKDSATAVDYSAYLGDRLAEIREENRQWFETRSKRLKLDTGEEIALSEQAMLSPREIDGIMDEDEIKIMQPDQPSMSSASSQELRISIKLDITLNSIQLLDRFEWDISDQRNSPEVFAAVFAADLGLGGEFRTAIAHSIREQIDSFVKSLFLLDHVSGLPIVDEELRKEFLPPMRGTVRAESGDFTPSLNLLNADELDRNDKEREREVRRKRRQTKGRGITLPDREPLKTHRTLVPKPSHIILQSYIDHHGNVHFPLPEMSHPYTISSSDTTTAPAEPVVPVTPFDRNLASPSKGNSTAFGRGPPRVGPGSVTTPKLVVNRVVRRALTEEDNFSPDEETNVESSTVVRATRGRPRGSSGNGTLLGGSPTKGGLAPKSNVELGLHEQFIHGAWHCANCGVPDIYCVGRRKGASGTNTLCGVCGKYYNRYRKNRPCEYSNDPAVHRAAGATLKTPSNMIIARAEAAKLASIAATSNPSLSQPSTSSIQPQSVVGPQGAAIPERRIRRPTPPGATRRRRQSSVSPPRQEEEEDEDEEEEEEEEESDGGSSFASEPARGRKSPDLPYGTPSPAQSGSASQASSSPPPAQTGYGQSFQTPNGIHSLHAGSSPQSLPLPWMEVAAANLRARQVDDRFEMISRGQGWKVKCTDCPGKLYNLGPGETLENFSVHFKNRKHRSNVDARIAKSG